MSNIPKTVSTREFLTGQHKTYQINEAHASAEIAAREIEVLYTRYLATMDSMPSTKVVAAIINKHMCKELI